MPQFTTSATQNVAINQNVLFTETPVRCTKGCVLHRDGSGIVTLKAPSNGTRARYMITLDANIAIPTGGTVAPIALAIAVNGEPLYSATAISTPSAVGAFDNVSAHAIVDVCGCCANVSARNVLPVTGTAPGSTISVANASLTVERIA